MVCGYRLSTFFDIVAGGRYYFGALLPEGLPALLEGPAPFGPFGGARAGFDLETRDCHSGFYAEGVAGYMYYFPSTWKWTCNAASAALTRARQYRRFQENMVGRKPGALLEVDRYDVGHHAAVQDGYVI